MNGTKLVHSLESGTMEIRFRAAATARTLLTFGVRVATKIIHRLEVGTSHLLTGLSFNKVIVGSLTTAVGASIEVGIALRLGLATGAVAVIVLIAALEEAETGTSQREGRRTTTIGSGRVIGFRHRGGAIGTGEVVITGVGGRANFAIGTTQLLAVVRGGQLEG